MSESKPTLSTVSASARGAGIPENRFRTLADTLGLGIRDSANRRLYTPEEIEVVRRHIETRQQQRTLGGGQ